MTTYNPNPTCEGDCSFSYSDQQITTAYYPPVYDKNGRNTNPDMNISSGRVTCLTCQKSWWYRTQLGETTYTKANHE